LNSVFSKNVQELQFFFASAMPSQRSELSRVCCFGQAPKSAFEKEMPQEFFCKRLINEQHVFYLIRPNYALMGGVLYSRR
jgi:hypothetical protein